MSPSAGVNNGSPHHCESEKYVKLNRESMCTVTLDRIDIAERGIKSVLKALITKMTRLLLYQLHSGQIISAKLMMWCALAYAIDSR